MSNIWFLEDEVDQSKLIAKLLSKMGHKVYSYFEPQNFLKELKELPEPDVIIFDLALKGALNGYQIAQIVVKERKIPYHKFMFISGWKPQFESLRPDEFKENLVLDKANWTTDDVGKGIEAILDKTDK